MQKRFTLKHDPILFLTSVVLLGIGLIMVASSAMPLSTHHFHTPFYYFFRQCVFASIGLMGGVIIYAIPLACWERYARGILLWGLLLLTLVSIPGIGHSVNGSRRWLVLGSINFQVSEFTKLCLWIYFAAYVARYQTELQQGFWPLARLLGVVALVAVLLLAEPDFGMLVIITSVAGSVLFLGGIPFRYVMGLLSVICTLGFLLIRFVPYRWARFSGFLDPWSDQFDSGYQLTQALLAFGRGGVSGAGLGNSVQKLFYLPEAHTDFIFAILAEEWGLVGTLSLLFLYGLLFFRGFRLAKISASRNLVFNTFLAYAITLGFTFQALVSMGVNMGLLPTKGLTLPFISYGGSSLCTSLWALAFLLRVSREVPQK